MADENESTVTPKRWIVLCVVMLLNISNAMLWLFFSSISNVGSYYFEVHETYVDLFALVFCITTVVFGIPEVWLVDKHGLRLAIILSALLNALGAGIRNLIWLKHLYPSHNWYAWTLFGQVVVALAQPFLYSVPTKVAEQWFPDNQRALATGLGIMASLVGQLIACGITPLFVYAISYIPYMTLWYSIPSFGAFLIALVAIRSSKPDVPPSNSAAISTSYPYISSLKTVLLKKESIFLIFGVGSILGVSFTLLSRMEEILCTRGYDSDFSGLCTMCVVGWGLLGAALASIVADRTRGFILIIKICLTLMVVSLCFFVVIVQYPDKGWVILTACGLVGFWGYAALPVGLELAMEHNFTILPEATSSGLIFIAGQLLNIIYFVFFETLSSVASEGKETCSKVQFNMILGPATLGPATLDPATFGPTTLGPTTFGPVTISSSATPDVVPKDSTCPLLILAGVTTFLVAIFILFFKSDYNRMRTENRSMSAIVNDDDPIINSTSFEDPSWHTSIYS